MKVALRRLLDDGWVLGIATAIAIGYAAVRVVTEIVEVVLRAIDHQDASGLFVFHLGGRAFGYVGVLTAAVTFAVVVVASAFLLARGDRG